MNDSIQLIHGDCLEKMKDIPENTIDAVITDPPYGLGFMGAAWDSTGISYDVALWKECLRVLKPGGYLLSFSGTRTYHRITTAIEDAGFEIRDMIEWVYGSGFPKSLSVGKAVDKLQGNEREIVGEKSPNVISKEWRNKEGRSDSLGEDFLKITKGTSEWEGWGTALKPSHEPICMARKPLAEKTVAENCLKWKTGGINIDESRVGETGARTNSNGKRSMYGGNSLLESKTHNDTTTEHNYGRFPANLIHDNSEEVRACFPDSKSGSHKAGQPRNAESKTSYVMPNITTFTNNGSSGNASRFFKSIIYQAKAGKSERGADNRHPTVKPVALMEYLINMVTVSGGIVLDPFAGTGTTLVAAAGLGRKAIGIELNKEYYKTAASRIKQERQIPLNL